MSPSTQNDLPVFFNVFWNLWKSLDILGCLQKSEIVQKFLKMTFQYFLNVFWNLRKLSEIFRNLQKFKIGKCQKVLKTIFRQFLKIFEDFQKCSENFKNPWKIFEYNQRFYKNFYNIPISGTCGLKIRFKSFCYFEICTGRCLCAFCTSGITLFALVLLFNCTALSQSEFSNFFM